ncbi:MAG: hypothetical protein NTZ38_02175, partial [Candidatus Taylorbacteria bacterium]|nr:hypothetical protein [Candidatus Taylorbacteria bacterium]
VSSLLNYEYFFNRNLYLSLLGNHKMILLIWLANAVIIVVLSVSSLLKRDIFIKPHKRLLIGSAVIFLLSILFLKGANQPFGQLVLELYGRFPLFSLFRSLQHYLSFYVITLSVLFTFGTLWLTKRNPKWIYLVTILVVINALPWWITRDIGASKFAAIGNITRLGEYDLSSGEEAFLRLNEKPLDFAMYTLPPGFSVDFKTSDGNILQGGDGGLSFGNKRFYATDVHNGQLQPVMEDIENKIYTDPNYFASINPIFNVLNVRYFILREEVSPLNSPASPQFDLKELQKNISKNASTFASVESVGTVKIMQNPQFLPHLYIPDQVVATAETIDKLPEILKGATSKAAVFLRNQNIDKDIPPASTGGSTVEYKKISPTKYRVVIHHTSGVI